MSSATWFKRKIFGNDDNPALPDLMTNPYGDAAALITVGDLGEGWQESIPGFGTQTGFWDLGSGGTIVIDIDNRAELLTYKEIFQREWNMLFKNCVK